MICHANTRASIGSVQGPFDSFLALRGLKTLDVRMQRHCQNAEVIANWLENDARVERVLYPGLESHPQHELATEQMGPFGGIVVECQDERSQHKNRARAMSLLQARLLDAEIAQRESEQAEERKLQVGSGDRSERIRTYNYPQGRVTDHRINLTLYKLAEILEGQLNQIIEPLISEYQADQLAQLAHD